MTLALRGMVRSEGSNMFQQSSRRRMRRAPPGSPKGFIQKIALGEAHRVRSRTACCPTARRVARSDALPHMAFTSAYPSPSNTSDGFRSSLRPRCVPCAMSCLNHRQIDRDMTTSRNCLEDILRNHVRPGRPLLKTRSAEVRQPARRTVVMRPHPAFSLTRHDEVKLRNLLAA